MAAEMKKLALRSLFALVLVSCLAALSTAAAQLKLDIKVFLGVGPRLHWGKASFEVLFSFNRWLYEGVNPSLGGTETQVNSFELPLPAGYIPYENPYFKWFG